MDACGTLSQMRTHQRCGAALLSPALLCSSLLLPSIGPLLLLFHRECRATRATSSPLPDGHRAPSRTRAACPAQATPRTGAHVSVRAASQPSLGARDAGRRAVCCGRLGRAVTCCVASRRAGRPGSPITLCFRGRRASTANLCTYIPSRTQPVHRRQSLRARPCVAEPAALSACRLSPVPLQQPGGE